MVYWAPKPCTPARHRCLFVCSGTTGDRQCGRSWVEFGLLERDRFLGLRFWDDTIISEILWCFKDETDTEKLFTAVWLGFGLEAAKVYSEPQKAGTWIWDDCCWDSLYFTWRACGYWCSKFPASTVICWRHHVVLYLMAVPHPCDIATCRPQGIHNIYIYTYVYTICV